MPQPDTQTSRRVKYGLNVALAVVISLAIVVLLNWLVARQVRQVAPEFRRLVRYDLTATRRYSLSAQTLAVIKSLDEDYRLVALLPSEEAAGNAQTSAAIRQTKDLVADYERFTNRISVEQINPDTEPARIKRFHETLRDRYADRLKPQKDAVEAGQNALVEVRKLAKAQIPSLESVLKRPELTDPSLRNNLQTMLRVVGNLDTQIDKINEQSKKALESALPNYSVSIETVSALMASLDEGVYSVASDQFGRAAQSPKTADAVKDDLLKLVALIDEARKQLGAAKEKLRTPAKLEEYEKLREQVSKPDSVGVVVVLSPARERVLPLEDMVRQGDPRTQGMDASDQIGLSFLGEERITGALAALQLKQPPMVVFVTSGRAQAFGRGGQYEHVVQRLQRLDFRVEQWNPGGQPGPMGQMQPPGPPPVAQPGQKVVWIVLPAEPPSMNNPMAGGAMGPVIKLLEGRLATGDSAMLMVSYSPMSGFGGGDELPGFLAKWGVKAQTDRLVLRERQMPDRPASSEMTQRITEWPDGLPITKALAGMAGVFIQPVPISSDDNVKDVKHWPLVEIIGQGLWAEKNPPMRGSAKRDPATSADKFVVAMASESKTGRLVVIGDPYWALDEVTTNADPMLRAVGLADMLGAAYPGNAELFVNSCYWLSGLDRLIAASARSQDLRRIDPISDQRYRGVQYALLLGLPVLILASGIGVWLVRRSG